MTRKEFKAAYTPSKVKPIPMDYMLVPYRADGFYDRCEAVKVYRSEKMADKAAQGLYEAGDYRLVVRPTMRVTHE